MADETKKPKPLPVPQAPNGVSVSVITTATWIGGYGARFEINNTTNAAISKWTIRVTYNTTTTIDWVDLTLVKTATGADLTPKSWTAPLRVGKTTIEFGGRGTPPAAAILITDVSPQPTPTPSPSPAPTVTPSPTPVPGPGGVIPARYFSPYVDVLLWPTLDVNTVNAATGAKWFTLAFITANSAGEPSWGGVIALGDNFYADKISALRAKGGDVVVSFGGANGQELGQAKTTVPSLVAAYQSVIDKYALKAVDFDIEGAAVADKASVDRRNAALKILGDNNPSLRMSLCLPVLPTGLTYDGVALIASAKAAGVRLDSVRVMAMDFGDSAAPPKDHTMGYYVIQAAQATIQQLNTAGLTNVSVGICPMIGVNDVATEIFYPSDAQAVVNFAKTTSRINNLDFWSANRDNGAGGAKQYAVPDSSSIVQNIWDFTRIFNTAF